MTTPVRPSPGPLEPRPRVEHAGEVRTYFPRQPRLTGLPATGSGQRARAAPLGGGDHLPVCPGLLRALDGSVVSECLGSCREGAGTLPRTPWRVQRRKGKGLGTSDCFESRAQSSGRREGRKYFRAFRESLESQAVSGGRNCLAPQREGRRREKGWTQKKWRGKKGDGRWEKWRAEEATLLCPVNHNEPI